MTDSLDFLRDKKICVESYGCTFNHADTCRLIEIAESQGCRQVPADEADVVVINTCTVVGATERHMLRRIAAHPDREVVVTGCMPLVQRSLLEETAALKIVLPEEISLRSRRAGGMVAPGIGAVQVGTGCLGSCSYCLTRKARGRLRSRNIDEILCEIQHLIAGGAREIQLTGQDVSAYGREKGTNLAKLLQAITDIEGDFFIRVGMLNPKTVLPILDPLVEAFVNPKIFGFVHLPVQSGSDSVLEAMGRGYTAGDFLHINGVFRASLPDVRVSTDFIVGFPTESERDFSDSLALLDKVKPTKVNITRFSRREGTPATAFPDLPDGVKKERSRALTHAANRIYDEMNARFIGQLLPAIVTEQQRAGSVVCRDPFYTNIVVKENLPLATRCMVRITGHRRHYLIGERTADSAPYR